MNRPQLIRSPLLPVIVALNALVAGALLVNVLLPTAGSRLVDAQLQLRATTFAAPTTRPHTPRDAFIALQAHAGFPLNAQWNPDTGIPEFLTAGDPTKYLPYTPTAAERGNPLAIARGFLDENRALFKLGAVDDELKLLRLEPDLQLGYSHIRLAQTYKGLNVFGRQLMVHLDAKAQGIVAVNGQFVPEINVETKAVLTSAEAEKLAINDLLQKQLLPEEAKTARYELRPARTELMVYVDQFNKATLAWRVKIIAWAPLGEYDFFVNARRPVVFHHIMSSHSAMRRMTYSARNSTNIPGRLVIDEGQRAANNPIAQAAHDGARVVYDYYFSKFKRNSIDGQGMPLVSTVNYGSSQQDAENAAWIGEAQQMIYGDGGRIFKPLPYGIDVVGHEFTHGVINTTADLVYEGQSGALNESMADVFGAFIDRGNWTIGEQVVKSPPFPVPVLRSLSDPNLGYYDPREPLAGVGQPANMKEYANLPISRRADNGGVHINSGIPNHAAYLTAQATGPDKAEQIYYRALTQYMTPRSNFLNAANALVKAAQELYGATEVTAVRNAWAQIGINVGGTETGPRPPDASGNTVPGSPSGQAEQPPNIPAGCQNVLQDPGFESGNGWVQESKGAIIDTELPHNGERSAWLGGTDQETTQIIYQEVNLPKNATTVELNYFRLIHNESSGGVLGGLFGEGEEARFSVLVANERGDVIGAIEQLTSKEGDDQWKGQRFDVSELAGKTIRLAFAAENPRGNISSFFVDDVYLVACTTGTGPAAPQTPSNDQIYLNGNITDADTSRGIYGAQVFVIREGLSASQAAQDDNVTASEVIATGTTDQNGFFQTDKPVKRGVTYSVIIIARGYRAIVANDGLGIPGSATNPFPVDATMRRSR